MLGLKVLGLLCSDGRVGVEGVELRIQSLNVSARVSSGLGCFVPES